ncbi:hypothetical protein OVA11_08195 [Caulobacter sp. SL161]|uniref:hypothetical protein n=1 Tax=Caulobacter sp. SL161 TaxID=2995156 RepID=UPI0022735F22|nr:hypothetical protein [Caulobacter sp. SL161]MCY1647033.1 hypothetical protein [Caulobacter sp. SL161]
MTAFAQDGIARELIDALNQAAEATMTPSTVQTDSAGKAYQMVALASALAVQDAVDSMRNVGTLADAASAAALSQLAATGEARYLEVLKAADEMRAQSVNIFSARAQAAAELLQKFPTR